METSLNKEQLDQVRMCAGLFYSPIEVALMLGLDVQSFLKAVRNEATAEYKSYHGGRLQADLEYRKKVYDLAVKAGSSPAQMLLDKMISKSEAKLNER